MLTPPPEANVEYIVDTIGSEGFVPVNSVLFKPHTNELVIISEAPIAEKPYGNFLFHLKNIDGVLELDISILDSLTESKITKEPLMTDIIVAKDYFINHTHFTESNYEAVLNNTSLYHINTIKVDYNPLTQSIIDFREGNVKSAKSIVDDFLSEQFGNSLKEHPAESRFSLKDVEKSEFETSSLNINDIEQFKKLSEEELDSSEINTLKQISEGYNYILSALSMTDFSKFCTDEVFIKYRDIVLNLPLRPSDVHSEIVKKIAAKIFENNRINSLITEIKSLTKASIVCSRECVDHISTSSPFRLAMIKGVQEEEQHDIFFDAFYGEYFKLYGNYKTLNPTDVINTHYFSIFGLFLSINYLMKYNNLICKEEVVALQTIKSSTNLDNIPPALSGINIKLLEIKEDIIRLSEELIEYQKNLITSNFFGK